MRLIVCLTSLLLLSSCVKTSQSSLAVDPPLHEGYLHQLPSAFPPLGLVDKNSDWGIEYRVGVGFGKQLDLYRAITAFKRSEILLDNGNAQIQNQIDYQIVLCYYLGRKYSDLVTFLQSSTLRFVDPSFPAYEDLLIILYDTYDHLDETEARDASFDLIFQINPQLADKLALGEEIRRRNIKPLLESSDPQVQRIAEVYQIGKKSEAKAQILNAVIPGSGYLYIGQRQTALTAFFLNAAFIAAAYTSFKHHNVPLGIIFASFEFGWYFGGIIGVRIEAQKYNDRLWTGLATPVLNDKKLTPALLIQYAF